MSHDLPDKGWGLDDRSDDILPDEHLDLLWNGVWEFIPHRVVWITLLPILEYAVLQVYSTWEDVDRKSVFLL